MELSLGIIYLIGMIVVFMITLAIYTVYSVPFMGTYGNGGKRAQVVYLFNNVLLCALYGIAWPITIVILLPGFLFVCDRDYARKRYRAKQRMNARA